MWRRWQADRAVAYTLRMTTGGIIDVGGERITNLGEPTNDDHAATKGYVDDSGGGSQPVTPPDITGLVLWLDATQIEGLTDSDPVALWPDASESGFDAAQSNADNRPSYETGVLNGRPVVNFDNNANPQFLELSGDGLALFQNTAAFTIIAANALGGSGAILYASANGDPDTIRVDFGPNEADVTNSDTTAWSVSDSALEQPNPTVSVLRFSGDVDEYGRLMLSIFPYHAKYLSADGTTEDAASDTIQIGNDAGSGQLGSALGDLAELIVYSRALNTLELNQLLDYLSEKWAI